MGEGGRRSKTHDNLVTILPLTYNQSWWMKWLLGEAWWADWWKRGLAREAGVQGELVEGFWRWGGFVARLVSRDGWWDNGKVGED